MKITVENVVDLHAGVREQRRCSLFSAQPPWFKRLLNMLGAWWAAAVVSIGIGYLIFATDGNWRTGAIVAAAALCFAVINSWWEAKKAQRAYLKTEKEHLDGQRTEIVAVDAIQITVGYRLVTETRYHHWLNNAALDGECIRLTGHVGQIVLDASLFAPHHVQQIIYWCNRDDKGFKDQCPKCKYNLQGSPGPACPECGEAVRIDESLTGEQPDVVIRLHMGEPG